MTFKVKTESLRGYGKMMRTHGQVAPPVPPRVCADDTFLQSKGEDLLGHDVSRCRRRLDRLHPAL